MLLHIYFSIKFLKNFSITLSISIIFMLLIDLIEQLRKFAVSIDFIDVFFLALLNLPSSVYQILPLIIIISSAWVFLSLARNSELIVFRAVGRSSVSMLITPAFLSFSIYWFKSKTYWRPTNNNLDRQWRLMAPTSRRNWTYCNPCQKGEFWRNKIIRRYFN